MLIRPEGYLSWGGNSWRDAAFRRRLEMIFRPPGELTSEIS